MALTASLKKTWPHVRAGLVLFHVACIFVLAFPAPVGGLDRAAWKLKNVQDELSAWANRLHMSEPVFEDLIYAIAVKWMDLRDFAAKPFGTYVSWTGCEQPWRMFVGPTHVPGRLQVQVKQKGAGPNGWQTLFEERSPEFVWHEPMFTQERLRSQIARWEWPQFGGEYDLGCAYLARLAFDEYPTVTDLRCRFFSVESPTPEQVRTHTEPQGAYGDERQHHRPEAQPGSGAP